MDYKINITNKEIIGRLYDKTLNKIEIRGDYLYMYFQEHRTNNTPFGYISFYIEKNPEDWIRYYEFELIEGNIQGKVLDAKDLLLVKDRIEIEEIGLLYNEFLIRGIFIDEKKQSKQKHCIIKVSLKEDVYISLME